MQIPKTLIQDCLRQQRKAQNKLYHLCFDALMKVVIRYFPNEERARPVLNQVFLKILLELDKYDVERPFAPWAKTLAIRVAIDELRKESRFDKEVPMVYIESPIEQEDSGFADKISADEVLATLEKLSPDLRSVFNLHDMDGYSHQEISELLQIHVRTSIRKLKAARFQLKELLEKKFQPHRINHE
jgi:RNA polymerase sigma factor (sigma-70 family)